ncbi:MULTISPECIES: helix-turn-helix domain-containing protein [Lysinibacillus]|uniref:Transcriptional regulator n=1 Tax=Lysinibacillus sphaericus TaxID=1421 RepID=A0A544UL26_LYSSH|nr:MULTISPECIES: helix-turn-helix domain-containing protein [Lysinibacillus]MDD1502305.1 helix-turn-helix domain-containing protein [Lysinibacillus sp. CNPSo 3705]MEB2280356.1 helix-turn-helix transcriptional regulator [Lysinibacillus xylanilyticus]TQR34170.1 transcriptional regulator [Lysinibacillus sp. SDF0037]UPW82941.1 helix-turn-helix transcriptional regulator [Lysinibacillus sp. Ag94]
MNESNLCPRLAKAMDLIGKRWTGLILYQLLDGPQRFNEIESSLPVSGRLLSERLKELEKEGLVERKVYSEVPVRVEYSLTDKGWALEGAIRNIESWASSWL